jgi:hypothetical protein
VDEGTGLRAQKRCESKPPFTAPQSCAHIASILKATCGSPQGIKPHPGLDEGSINEKGVVVETSTHSINARRGESGCGDRAVSPRYHGGRVFLQAHAEMNLCLTGGYTHSLTEEGADESVTTLIG